jgi:outer membrane protein assembly factor BamB
MFIRALVCLILLDLSGLAADWPRFRGPNGSGVSEARNLPVEFGTGKNLTWKVEAPMGNSSPVTSGDRVFLTGYEGNRRLVWCLDRKRGTRLWEGVLEATRVERKSEPNDAASSTAVTDGRHVYALFSGFGLVCYTMQGRERWRTPLEPFTQPHGMSSSPILADGAVIVVADQITDSYIAAFALADGRLKWKTPRPNFVGGYSTPLVFHAQVVAAGPAELAAYRPATGERLWSAPRMGVMPIGSPICEGDRIFVNNGAVPPFESLAKELKADLNGDGKLTPDEFPDPSFKEAVLAIDRAYGNGDGAVDKAEWDGALKLMQTLNALVAVRVEGPQPKERWRTTKSLPDVPSPLLYQNILYLLKDGLLASVNPDDGTVLKHERLSGAEGRYFASPVAADGKVYTVSEGGKIAVVKDGSQWELLQVNDLGEQCYATPALADGQILIRTKRTLWAFDEKAGQQ